MDSVGHNNSKALSVSAAMAVAKDALESCTLTLVGEVSELSNKPGYKAVYFTVKDEGASLPALMWTNRFHASGVDLHVGMLVQLTGRFTLYALKGRMNFEVFSLTLAGEGDLRAKVAALAKKLEAEGLMDPSRKRALPSYPQTIGLVTSPRGAAVHDVLRTLRRRFPLARVLLAGVPVEGASAPSMIATALESLAQSGVELVLLVRGGGSFEDLMPFNDEALARTIAGLPVPVVTGIGHEPDTSIADMVADLRASTPTAAAEAVTPNSLDLAAVFAQTEARLSGMLAGRIERSRNILDSVASRPVLADGQSLFATEAQRIDIAAERIQRALPKALEQDRAFLASSCKSLSLLGASLTSGHRQSHEALHLRLRTAGSSFIVPHAHALSASAARLDDLSPLGVLGRGYSLARTSGGALVKSVDAVQTGDALHVRVSDGTIDCTVNNKALADSELLSWKDGA